MTDESDADTDPRALATHWLAELEAAGKAEAKWRDDARRVLEVYRDDSDGRRRARFNILFSNVQTLAPAVYAGVPRPDVRRRFRDADPVARRAAETVERALAYGADAGDLDAGLRAVVHDALLTGRGVARVRYVPRFAEAGTRVPCLVTYQPAGPGADDFARRGGEPVYLRADTRDVVADPEFDGQGPFVADAGEQVAAEAVTCEAVHWDDFRVDPARSWDEVRWVAFRAHLTRAELVDAFGPERGAAVPIVAAEADGPARGNHAEVWEVWDRESRTVIFVAPAYAGGVLRVEDDPLGLAGFFPCPRPLYAIATSGSLVPYPEYLVYEDQARELNEVTRRIEVLTKALKLRGIYDAAQPEIAELLSADDNKMIPSENFLALAERGGLDKAVQFAPVEMVAAVLAQLHQSRDRIKQTIYEITGLADILRGATQASETATAQSIKARWGSARLAERQREVQRLIRDVFRLQAEVIAERFSAETLRAMTGVAVDDAVLAVLRSDGLRGFRIDVETDATAAGDAADDQRAVTELLSGVTSFVRGIAPLVAAPSNPQGVIPVEAAKALLMAAVRRFRLGREVEDALDTIGKAPPGHADRALPL